ncbi:MAG: substrate-binding domain-containing protein [Spirochaetota bacterium]
MEQRITDDTALPALTAGVFFHHLPGGHHASPYTADIFAGFYSFKSHRPVHWIQCDTEHLEDYIRTNRLDGAVIVSPNFTDNDAVLSRVRDTGLPVVLVNHDASHLGIPSVRSDNTSALTELARHLVVTLKVKHAAFVGYSLRFYDAVERLSAFRKALSDFGGSLFDDDVLFTEGDTAKLIEWLNRVVRPDSRPRALVVNTEFIVRQTMIWTRESRIRVPADIYIAGFDDPVVYELNEPTITAIKQPLVELGTTAAQMLLSRMEHPDAKLFDIVLENKIIYRTSLPLGHQ